MRYRTFIIALLLYALAVPAAALEARLIDYRIELHMGWPLSGKISERLRQLSDGTWQLERNGLVFGFTATEVSKFKVMGSEVQSIWYRKEQTGIPGDRKREISFKSGDSKLYDPISLAIKIAADLNNDPKKTSGTYRLTERQGKEKHITFNFMHGQILDTDLGEIETVRVDQVDKSETERRYWLSPQHGYIIIRAIERDEDGDIKSEINIRNGSVGGKPLKTRK